MLIESTEVITTLYLITEQTQRAYFFIFQPIRFGLLEFKTNKKNLQTPRGVNVVSVHKLNYH